MNLFSWVFLGVLFTGLGLQFLLVYRHIRHIQKNRHAVPTEFAEKISLSAHQKAADYTTAKARLFTVSGLIEATLLLLLTFGGWLQWIDSFWRGYYYSELVTGTVFLLSVFAIILIVDIPVSLYRIFVIEERFGFNKMTLKLYITDTIKQCLLSVAIGIPLILGALWLMAVSGSYWWAYLWMGWIGFSLFMLWAYPSFIAPLFNSFKPLENLELKKRIETLLSRNGFKSQGIFIMNGSARSAHGNAYFTGLGANKRIVFFDTLIDELSFNEIEAVLAHELGHFKCRHIVKRMSMIALVLFIALAVLGQLIALPSFYHGLGVTMPSHHMALILFAIGTPLCLGLLQPLFSLVSRRHEFEADDFAASQGHVNDLITALVNLYRENANTLTPDPLYSAFHDSHPPAPIRIAHLKARQA